MNQVRKKELKRKKTKKKSNQIKLLATCRKWEIKPSNSQSSTSQKKQLRLIKRLLLIFEL